MENISNVISVENLSKKFGNFVAVDSITFHVKKGEIFGFLGANGAGKTTAIKILCGLMEPTSGKARVAGYDVFKQPEMIKKNIGYMSQKFSLYEDLTVKENIVFYGGIYGLSDLEIKEKTKVILEQLQLNTIENTLIHSLPLGWKQKLAFSIAIIHKPSIVFLDEPTSGVDPITRRQFWDMIYNSTQQGITVFITTHYLEEAEYCDRISIMAEGKIKAMGKPVELKNQYHSESIVDIFTQIST